MKVFALGTGRCGTVTFSKACKHFNGLTVGHESKSRHNKLIYPDNHIESDPHLFWQLPSLIKKEPDALYVHLIRERQSCISSLSKRKSLMNYATFTEMIDLKTFDNAEYATKYYDFCNDTISITLRNSKVHYIEMTMPPSKEQWQELCLFLGRQRNFNSSFNEWSQKHNNS